MRTVGTCLIFAAVALRAAVVVSATPEFPAVIALLAGYGLLLTGETWLIDLRSFTCSSACFSLPFCR